MDFNCLFKYSIIFWVCHLKIGLFAHFISWAIITIFLGNLYNMEQISYTVNDKCDFIRPFTKFQLFTNTNSGTINN